MIDNTPLIRPADRFPIGLAGHIVPLSAALPTTLRPWGMDHAVSPPPLPEMGRHEKPTSTTAKPKATTHSNDSKLIPDTDTITVTD